MVCDKKTWRTTALDPVRRDWVGQAQYTQYIATKWQTQHSLEVTVVFCNRPEEVVGRKLFHTWLFTTLESFTDFLHYDLDLG